jgi:glycogen debranching enzyme
VDNWVVTPRQGKAVEINALWYNAWRIYASFLELQGEKGMAKSLEERAAKIRTRFQAVFWEEGTHSLHDCVLGDEIDRSIRPNQLFALSLPFPLLDVEQAGYILTTIEEHLLTPRGLRSLSSADPQFKGHYGGDVYERDGAYHQGTVWGWLIGPYLDALIYVRGKWGKERARLVLNEFLEHLDEGCVGSLSEIFDGADPFTPRGCYAQAWSVSEVLRTHHAYQLLAPVKRSSSLKPKLNLFDRMVAAGFL